MASISTELTPPLSDAFRATFEAELDYIWTNLRRFGVREADLEVEVGGGEAEAQEAVGVGLAGAILRPRF